MNRSLLPRRAAPGQALEALQRAVDTRWPPLYRNCVEGLHQFLEILIKPDNIPIVGMLVLVLFFTWLGFKQALRNDRLEEQGRESEILKEMQE